MKPDNPPKGHVRVWADMVVNITEPLEGKLLDWPRRIQDKIFAEIERRGLLRGRRYKYWNSQCGVDGGQPFIHVVVYDDVPLNMLNPPTLQ